MFASGVLVTISADPIRNHRDALVLTRATTARLDFPETHWWDRAIQKGLVVLLFLFVLREQQVQVVTLFLYRDYSTRQEYRVDMHG